MTKKYKEKIRVQTRPIKELLTQEKTPKKTLFGKKL